MYIARDLRAPEQPEKTENCRHMGLDGCLRQPKQVCYLLVRQAERHALGDMEQPAVELIAGGRIPNLTRV